MGGVVNDLGVPPGDEDRSVPLEPVVQIPRGDAVGEFGIDDHVAGPRLLPVLPFDLPDVVPGVGELGAAGRDPDVAAFPSRHLQPVAFVGQPAVGPRGHRDRGVVLLGAVEAAREGVVHGEPVELGGGLVVDRGPGLTAVEGHHRSPVVRLHHDPGILGVDPEVVVVAVRNRHRREREAAVHRLQERGVQDVHRVRVGRVGDDVGVVPAPAAQPPVAVDPPPALPSVLAPVEPAPLFGGCHERIDPARSGGGDRDADPADRRLLRGLGQSALDAAPGVAAVLAPEQPALGPAVHQRPRLSLRFPDRGEQAPRVRGVHRQIHRPGEVGDLEDRLPARPAVLGAIDAPLFRASEDLTQHGDEGAVRIEGIHHDPADEARLGKADVGPVAAPVGRAVHPVADRDVPPGAGRARPHPDHLGVGWRDRDRADGTHREVVVGDVGPRDAGVLRLPHAAPGGAHPELVGPSADPGDGGHPAAAGGTHHAEVETGHDGGGRGKVLRNLGPLHRPLRRRERREEERAAGDHSSAPPTQSHLHAGP